MDKFNTEACRQRAKTAIKRPDDAKYSLLQYNVSSMRQRYALMKHTYSSNLVNQRTVSNSYQVLKCCSRCARPNGSKGKSCAKDQLLLNTSEDSNRPPGSV